MIDRKALVEKLVRYAQKRLSLGKLDSIYVRNVLLTELHEESPYEGTLDWDIPELPDDLYVELETALGEIGTPDPHKKAVALFGLLTPMPDEVDHEFARLMKDDPVKATDYLLEIGRRNGYYAETALKKNIRWDATYEDGKTPLVITINLSKPEKNNKDIAAALKKKDIAYPSCMLCPSNLGYEGDAKVPPRGTLRFASLTMADADWYVQYSPYGYYSHHVIAFSEDHHPMEINRDCFRALLDFVELFPHFFIGSNSDLPIVGGSILTHEHFQGGDKELPLLHAKKRKLVGNVDGVEVSILDFYDSCLVLEGKDKKKIVELGEKILMKWRHHVDASRSFPGVDPDGTRHQTLTPFAKKEGELYHLYLILRCNSVSEKHPGGIYHAHEERWAIKQEGIGLIEAAGLFILPARLKRQLGILEEGVKNKKDFSEIVKDNGDLQGFSDCYAHLLSGMGTREYINGVCREILNDVAVYKDNEIDQEAFMAFAKGAIE